MDLVSPRISLPRSLTGKFNVGGQACRAPVLQRFLTRSTGGILAARCSSGPQRFMAIGRAPPEKPMATIGGLPPGLKETERDTHA